MNNIQNINKDKQNLNIAIVASSTRIGQKSNRIGTMLKSIIENTYGQSISLIDLSEETLPLFSERFQDVSEPSQMMKKISRELSGADAIILITPEYNGSVSPALKNLIDIYGTNEFADKPIGVATVTSGKIVGIRAAVQLQNIILAIKGYPFPQMLLATEITENVDESGQILSTEFDDHITRFLSPFLSFAEKLATNELVLS
jgi:NAD(P)H-dependent FMN reductase